MRDALGQGTILGYCTNVHAGATWDQTKANLQQHALAVKQRVSPAEPMGIGLWLSAQTARELVQENRIEELRDFLGEHGLLAYTFNGFPYGDFHQPVVKHRVYEPDWSDPARVAYTKDLIAILAQLLPDDQREGSISTLPVGWKTIGGDAQRLQAAARNLLNVAEHLQELEQNGGPLIHVDLEPEPGCYLERAPDVVRFFTEHLAPRSRQVDVTRHVRVCHDVCHTAVMFEDQTDTLRRYKSARIRIGKVQIASAIRVDFDSLNRRDRWAASKQLGDFQEARYLHQTVVQQQVGGPTVFYEDLPSALSALADAQAPVGEWRVHFHVPIYVDQIGLVGTTQEYVGQCLELLRNGEVGHWEVETYAWEVLPDKMKQETLADGIAEELMWLLQSVAAGQRTEGT